MKNAVITGVNGQDGAFLSKLLLEKGYKVTGIIKSWNANISKLKYLGIENDISYVSINLCNYTEINSFIKNNKIDEIYNLSAQSSVRNSFINPIETLTYNYLSTLNILESIRKNSEKIKIYQASSSEMFGKVDSLPIKGDENFHPMSPYAVSKASAHMMTKNYRETYGLFACTGILFNHESYLRTENFFIKKVIMESINISKGIQENLVVGNIDIKRDFGSAERYVEAMYLMMQKDNPDDYLVCSGVSILLRDIIYYVFSKFNISNEKLIIDKTLYRPLEIFDIYGDNHVTKKKLNWNYNLDFYDFLDELINEEIENYVRTK